jgi:hypothetical protein
MCGLSGLLDNQNATGVQYKYSCIADETGDQNFSMVHKKVELMVEGPALSC